MCSGRGLEGEFIPHFISLERSEECEQSVVWFKSRCGLASGSQFLQGLLLNEQVGLNVAMRSLNVLIAPAQGEFCDVHARLEQMKSTCRGSIPLAEYIPFPELIRSELKHIEVPMEILLEFLRPLEFHSGLFDVRIIREPF